jgi:WD40 repeat protein
VVLWNTQTAKEQARHRLKLAKSSKAGQVSVLRFTPKGGGLVVGHHLGEESEWLLIDAELGKVIHRQALHRSRPLHIEWLPDGKFLAASERSVYRFDLLKFEQSMNMIIDPPLNAFGLSSDGKEFWTRASDGRLARYSLERGLRLGVSEMDAPSAKESAWCSVVRLAGRKQTLISGSGQEVSLCDFTSPADPVRTLPLGKTPPGVHPLVATPDGKHLLAANIGGEVKIFEVDAVIRGSKP